MIRPCTDNDFDTIWAIVNDAAQAYKGVIPADRWHEPYMPREELKAAIDSGVQFWGCEQNGALVGVMGVQRVQDVTLIRHAYVRTTYRRHGIGGQLLVFLLARTTTPTLMGTWAAAGWAIRFYEKHGFRLVTPEEKDRLLPKYWGVPQRQIETSVVLGDRRWFDATLGDRRTAQRPGVNIRLTTCEESLDAIRAVRNTVFGREQNVPLELEWDGADPACIHVVAIDSDGNPMGTGRLQPDGRIGRLAVLKPWRCQGVGGRMLDMLIKAAYARGLKQVHLHAQIQAVPFYEKRGFRKEGEEFVEAGIRHVTMTRAIHPADKGRP